MNKSKVLVGIILLFYLLFVVFQFSGSDLIAQNLRALIFPSIGLAYFLCAKDKSIFFSLFLIFYSLSDIMVIVSDQISYEVDYYLGNSLYIIAYGTLLFKVCKSINLIHILKNFKIHLIVLTALNIYIATVLQLIIDPNRELNNEYILETIYNVVILLLLSGSLLNYFYRDNKKALYLFIGSLCIVFSEVINVAYLYVTKQSLLNFIATSLALLAVYFLYQQTKIENTEEVDMLID